MKVSPSALPGWIVGVVHCPPSSVAVCGAAPVFEKVMTWPVLAVMSAGWKAKSMTLTATAPVSAVSLQTDAALDASLEAALDAALDAAGELLLDEQAANMTMALTARAATVRWDTGFSLSGLMGLSGMSVVRRWVRPRRCPGFERAIVSG